MSLLRQALYGLGLLLTLGLFIRLNALERSASEARTQAAKMAQAHSETALRAIRDTLEAERRAQARLRREHHQLAALATERERLIEELKRENTELAQWAGQPLPELARGLHQRPALSGAAAYREWMSRRGALHAEREPAAQ
ncbi:Rz-like lysis system protein LysB [Pseudomonas sp. RIT-PI-S]|uniref:Rz-like lysis system protein LysB n=1 Tax=Pseudomonas sp. RIT-PI-S TaxID=3035295 RepID=UPI0021D919CB|nr:Rz-like lysis system protein LysB [Pseudomonas sp. RIT-PI-S]